MFKKLKQGIQKRFQIPAETEKEKEKEKIGSCKSLLEDPDIMHHITQLSYKEPKKRGHLSDLEIRLVNYYIDNFCPERIEYKHGDEAGKPPAKKDSVRSSKKDGREEAQKSKEKPDESNYLDPDENHIQGEKMQGTMERKNLNKIQYLQRENTQLKMLLEDAQNNTEINKNMINVILENNENANDKNGMKAVVDKLNQENVNLVRTVKQQRRDYDSLNSDLLIKNQVFEETNINHELEKQHIESELEAIKHKYDRKELVLQNLERKMNYFEMYVTKQASEFGLNDKEAQILIRKFQHEKFSGGIESNDLYKMQKKEENKLSNIVQENIELKKQNADLKKVLNGLIYIKEIHMSLMEKCKKTMSSNEIMKRQVTAQDNMIKDLVSQIQQQRKEGQDLVAQNYQINDKLMALQQANEVLRIAKVTSNRVSKIDMNGPIASGNKGEEETYEFDPSPDKLDRLDDDLEFDEDNKNGDLKVFQINSEPLPLGDYSTQVVKPTMDDLLKDEEEDGLPTILEQSHAEPIGNPETVDNLDIIKAKSFVERKHNANYNSMAHTYRNSEITGSGNMTALKLQYKHRRMQSKNALFNQYRSLSIMNGDDMSKFLNQSGRIRMDLVNDKKQQQDFDDISSVYTAANAQNEHLERTLKRVRNRDELLSNLDERDDIGFLNNQLENNEYHQIDETPQEHDNSQYLPTEKDEEVLEKYFSANQKEEKKVTQHSDEKSPNGSGNLSNLDMDQAQSDINLSNGESGRSSENSKEIQDNLEAYDFRNYAADEHKQIKNLIQDQRLLRNEIEDGDLNRRASKKIGDEQVRELDNFIQEGQDLYRQLGGDQSDRN